MSRNNIEYKVHKALCDYIRMQYKNVLFNSDASGLNLSMAQSGMFKPLRKFKGHPDLVIYHVTEGYSGLFLEIKHDGSSPFKKNGDLKSNEHLQNQQDYQRLLEKRGYKACFCVGFDHGKKIIDEYLKSPTAFMY